MVSSIFKMNHILLLSFFLCLFFYFFWSLDSLLGVLAFLILFLISTSVLVWVSSSGQWLALAILIALVSGLIVVLTFVILMFPTPKWKLMSNSSLIGTIPFVLFFTEEWGENKLSCFSSIPLTLKSDFSQTGFSYPFISFFLFAVTILLSMLFVIELLIKPRSVSLKTSNTSLADDNKQ